MRIQFWITVVWTGVKSPPEYKVLRCRLEILEIAEIAYFASAVVQCKMSIEAIAGFGNFKWGGGGGQE